MRILDTTDIITVRDTLLGNSVLVSPAPLIRTSDRLQLHAAAQR